MCNPSDSPRNNGLSVRWRSVAVRINGKEALRECSGDAELGTLTAVMGASGAGKTTLLNALSRRGPVTSGEIRFGDPGEPWSRRLKTQVGYVAQDDTVYQELTVRESLAFTADLRLAASAKERSERIAAVLADLQRPETRLGALMETAILSSATTAAPLPPPA